MKLSRSGKINNQFILLSIILSIGLFLTTSTLGFYYFYSNKKDNAFHVSKVIEGMLATNQYREALYSLSNAKLGSFDAIGYYDSNENRVFTLPPSVEPNYFKEEQSVLDKTLSTTIPVHLFFDDLEKKKIGTLFFTFYHHRVLTTVLIFYALAMALLMPILFTFKKLLNKSIERDILIEKNHGIEQTVRQVWHDLNQPMQFLYAFLDSYKNLEDNARGQIRDACDDMRSILDDLKGKRNQSSKSLITPHCLASVIKEIAEKEKLKYQKENKEINLEITPSALSSFSLINESDLKRIISNLSDNAAKASKPNDKIVIRLNQNEDFNIIEVEDFGVGIKKEHLKDVGTRGITFREGGNGLGLSFSIDKVKSWGGTLTIDSKEDIGTKISISLPKKEIPDWFKQNFNLLGNKTIALIDDKIVMHNLLKKTLQESEHSPQQFYFQRASDFTKWYEEKDDQDDEIFYIFDYNLGEEKTGINLISEKKLEKSSVLVTNYYDDQNIQDLAIENNIQIFPKNLIDYISL